MIATSERAPRRSCLAAAFALTALLAAGGAGAATDPDLGVAPSFRLEDTAGETVDLQAALDSGPVILDFWATWCAPCRQALPGLQQLHERYAERGLTVLAISTDEPRNRPKIDGTARALGLTFPVLIDSDKRVAQLYRVESVPMTFLVDRDGRIRALHRGYLPGDLDRLEQELLPLLEPSPPVPAVAPREGR